MKLSTLFSMAICGCIFFSAVQTAHADGEPAKAKKSKRHAAARVLTEDEKLARDYAARRKAGGTDQCPCEGNAAQYCSCNSGRGGYGYGYGYGYHSDPYATSAGWSRSYWRGSDLPSTGYSAPYTR